MGLAPEELLALVLADPERAAVESARAADDAAANGDLATRSAALRAAGLAAHALHDAATAGRHLRHAIRVAQAAGDPIAEAEARMSHSLVLDDLGHPAEALREVERACRGLSGPALGRARMQQSLILRRVGRTHEAMRGYDAALATFRASGDAVWEARTLGNRGLLHGYHGATAAALADLHAAEAIFVTLNLPAAVAQTQHNIGYIYAQAGDVVAALEHYERAREQLGAMSATALTEQNRAEFLLSCRLLPEAREAAAASIEAARTGHNAQTLGQSQVLAARIELTAGAAAAARVLAARARATFLR
ncbi:MAG TPA: CHAT domain-containing protein, partial [Micromonosporaceae bacterium]